MKILSKKYILILLSLVSLVIFEACSEDVDVEAVYITAAEKSKTVSFSARNNGDNMGITVSTSLVANSEVEVLLSIDNSLVEKYNSENGESFQSLPEGTCSLSETKLVVATGTYRSDAIKLVVNDVEKIGKGLNYLVPVKLTSKNGNYPSLPGSDVLYVIINRTLLMNVPTFNGGNCLKVNFKDQDVSRLQNLESFTLEARVSMWDFPKYYQGNLMGILGFPEDENLDLNAWLFVDGTPDRVGGAGNIPVFMFGVRKWALYAGKLGYTIERDTWYHIAGVYSNNTLKLYINGELFTEAEYSKKVSFTNNFYIGGAPGAQSGNPFYLKGSVSEARLWRRALSSAELRNPLHQCFVESDSEGLEGYWKLDDNSNTCKDYSGNGHDAVIIGSGDLKWTEGVPCPN
ncbi:DUF1735 and LamG domain-containing protein [Dysgonomonas massiliensis]|uniref:DUF1735 and LamG domain-containing protein n=1 Tax=Dysgonomonas massiliensis TaxID=2040292 RepID=UPI000C76992B|nr:DUF1735 and LamG domain-containing protein [Dysgonomonas massiliensis]